MKTVKQLQEERGAITDKIKATTDKATAEKRNLTDDEFSEIQTLAEQRDALDKDIAKAQFLKQEELQRATDEVRSQINVNIGGPRNTGGEEGEKRSHRQNFSFVKAIGAQFEGRQLEGREKEVVEAGMQEALAAKRSITGMAIPSFFMLPNQPEQRAQSVGTAATAGDLVETQIGLVVEYLYPKTVLREMGATFWNNLTSNVDIIRQDGPATAIWEGENDDNANTDPTVESVPLRPKRLGAQTIFGKQLAFQTRSLSVENWVRNNLNMAQGVGLETALLNGSGTAPIPEGLLNISGIGDVAIGTNGGAPTWQHILDLETKIADNNAEFGTLAYLTTAIMRGKLKNTKKDAGSGEFVWDKDGMNGYRAFISTLLPKTLVKGTSSDCHPIIFGNFAEMYVGQWDGLDIVVDPYTLAKKAQIAVTINGYYDVNLGQLASFAATQDARNV